jgi:hypothetical protein
MGLDHPPALPLPSWRHPLLLQGDRMGWQQEGPGVARHERGPSCGDLGGARRGCLRWCGASPLELALLLSSTQVFHNGKKTQGDAGAADCPWGPSVSQSAFQPQGWPC